MKYLHTTEFDNNLQNQLPHLKNYPELLPFIGDNWNESKLKTLIIAESHYIDINGLKNFHIENWYENSSKDFNQTKLIENKDYYTNYINTRYNVDFAEKIKEKGFKKPYIVYYNIKKEIKEHISDMKDQEYIFSYFSFYNYFQRPALIQGESIKDERTKKDIEIAYDTIKKIVTIIKPKKVIFISKLSFNTFLESKKNDTNSNIFNGITIVDVPHPGSAWWNRRSKNYGKNEDSNKYRTGKERFIHFII